MKTAERIAIVGMGAVLPGSSDIAHFWSHVLAERSVAREVPPGRWPMTADKLHAAGVQPDRVYSTRGCFVEDFVLDAAGLDVPAELLAQLDPMFQMLLAAGRQAWQDAVTQRADKKRVGIIIGNIALPTEGASAWTEQIWGPLFDSQTLPAANGGRPHALNRFVAGLPAGLLAQALGLGGGAFTLDAACASSLYALKLAADELLAGRADIILTGGLSRPDCLYTQMGFSQLRALSKTGVCAPFDARADGLVVGEGAAIFVLKRLSDAVRAGDRIYATIAGIGLSNDIGGNLMLPDSAGQLRAMRAAYTHAGWKPSDVRLIECHGTGTPIGDGVEFNSLRQLWRDEDFRPGQCVIGSVKSNVGHLLTAAGGAGLIKVLLAMRDGTLPPTANFSRGAAGIELEKSPFEILRAARGWADDAPRRAAISAFGFGGINAHVLLEAFTPEAAEEFAPARFGSRAPLAIEEDEIAIVGMGAHFGPWKTLDAVARRMFGAEAEPQMPQRWWGSLEANAHRGFFMDDVKMPVGRFRIPPAELAEMLPQQLLMLQVAADALADAKLETVEGERLDTGVFIGIGLDLNTTNFRFRWLLQKKGEAWAREQNVDPESAEVQQWIAELREAAGPALTANRTMGALGGIVASRIARAFHMGGPAFTVSSEETSGLHAVEVGVRALQRGEVKVAVVGAVDLAGDLRCVMGQRVDGKERLIGEGAAALVLKRRADALRDGDHIYAFISGCGSSCGGGVDSTVLQDAATRAERAAGSVKSNETPVQCDVQDVAARMGNSGAAGGIAAVVKAALALRHRLRDEAGVTRHWLRNRAEGRRGVLVRGTSVGGNCEALVLREADQPEATGPSPVAHSHALFCIGAPSAAGMLGQLNALSRLAQHWAGDANGLATEWHRVSGTIHGTGTRAAIVVRNCAELRTLLGKAEQAVHAGAETCREGLSYFPARLVGKLAFVFPGAGNAYAGMGRELATWFPKVMRRMDEENEHLAGQFADGAFWSQATLAGISHRDQIFGQVWLGTLVSDAAAACGVMPRAVIGYSLGETTGLFATRAWRDRDEMLARMNTSTLFDTDLAGPCNAVRKAWRLQNDERVDWSVGMVDRAAEVVSRAIAGKDRVYLLIVNTPGECVVGGDRTAVATLVRELGCGWHPVEGVTTVHCAAARPVEEAYRALHLMETTAPKGVTFYSGIKGAAYAVTRKSAAESIVGQAMAPFDFTKVIEAAYAEGVRFFIEMGPGATCSRMIGRILGSKPHMARSACIAGQEGRAFLETLGECFARGVEVNLDGLYGGGVESETKWKKFIHVPLEGDPFHPPAPPIRKRTAPGMQPAMIASAPHHAGEIHVLPLIEQFSATQIAHAKAQENYLRLAQQNVTALSQLAGMQASLMERVPHEEAVALQSLPKPQRAVALDRAMCMEFAVGSIARVLGPAFADIDAHPTRVRLPDEPLMLVDRIVELDAVPQSMTGGRVVTEHDVLHEGWYLDCGRIPTCIAVEAGQADLFLSGYLGIDFITKGRAVYRLLDAVVTFHGPLPRPGQVIVYDIAIDHFFRQGETYLFRFKFDATVDGVPVLTMRNGCAGFFTEQELAAGQGIVLTAFDKRPAKGKRTPDWHALTPMRVEKYSDAQVQALREDDLAACFGEAFSGLALSQPVGLPGGRMTLVHRVLKLDPEGGRFGIGQITGEADIRPDDWFMTCHFVDDRVMPGTLMYECCLHTLRIYLLRMGWVAERGTVAYEPIPEVASTLKCRGQVTVSTQKVQYEVTLKEMGYQADGTPYAIADALMYGDGRAIVQMTNMSVKLTGATRESLETLWAGKATPHSARRPALFDTDRITAFAIGRPSEAFGDRYRMFDSERKIARLPGPPFQFLDRIVSIHNCMPFKLEAGAIIEAEYDVPPDAWYFPANQQNASSDMPFSVLLEAALQPCGWLAAYLGSALASPVDIKFRNLGGSATQLRAVTPDSGTLTTTVKMTSVSNSGGMLIQHFEMTVRSRAGEVYRGSTYFGFFSKDALGNQVGIRDAAVHVPTAAEQRASLAFDYPQSAPFADQQMRMVDRIDVFAPQGGSKGLGFIQGSTRVNADAWFFKAHFFEDPVWPGSLGLESFLQLLKVAAHRRWGGRADAIRFETMALGHKHSWVYRGQILPTDKRVTVQATITAMDDGQHTMVADGFLSVDGRAIYQMNQFAIRMHGFQ